MRPAAPVPVVLLTLTLLLAGCGGSGANPSKTTLTCDGKVVEVNATTEAGAACPKVEPPSIAITTFPPAARVYSPVSFAWSVQAGDHAEGHSMLTSLRVSSAPIANQSLSGPGSYGTEIAKKEHQMLPSSPTAEHMFTLPGTYYIRAYATIQGKDLEAKDYWTPERTLVVADIEPTGNDVTVTHGLGDAAGKLTPDSVQLQLGDGVILKNGDLKEHAFTPKTCAQFTEPVVVASMASSAPLVFKAPGTCTFETDDVTPLTLTVNVSA